MKAFRKVLFWLHLSAGVFAGIVVFIMSLTGVLLTYEKQMVAWAGRGYRAAPPSPEASRLPINLLLDKVREAHSATPSTITLHSDPDEPVAFVFGRESTVYVNPYSGEVLGQGSAGIRSFFRVATDWHRWLGASDESRAKGRAVTGACNLAFLFLVMSGFYLWWPREWAWRHLKNVMSFRGGLSGKALDFNWHNVIGFWCAVPLLFIVFSGSVISFPWMSNFVYRIVGEEPPAPVPGRPARGPGASGSRRGEQRTTGQKARAGHGAAPREPRGNGLKIEGRRRAAHDQERRGDDLRRRHAPPDSAAPSAYPNPEGLDRLLARAKKKVSGWRTINMRVPGSDDEPVTFTIYEGAAGQPHLRSTLTLDPQPGKVVDWETFSSQTAGRRLRLLLRFVHTGEAGGAIGQTLAGIVSAGAVVLAWTGLALAWRRFRAWRMRGRTKNQALAKS